MSDLYRNTPGRLNSSSQTEKFGTLSVNFALGAILIAVLFLFIGAVRAKGTGVDSLSLVSIVRAATGNTKSVAELDAYHPPSTVRVSKEHLRELVVQASAEFGVPSNLVWAVISVESSFDQYAVSPAGAQGLMQLMPTTARQLSVINPFSARENVRGGTQYLAKLLKRYNGDARLALAAYNAGPAAVAKYKGIPPYPETKNYVKRVMSLYRTKKAPRKPVS